MLFLKNIAFAVKVKFTENEHQYLNQGTQDFDQDECLKKIIKNFLKQMEHSCNISCIPILLSSIGNTIADVCLNYEDENCAIKLHDETKFYDKFNNCLNQKTRLTYYTGTIKVLDTIGSKGKNKILRLNVKMASYFKNVYMEKYVYDIKDLMSGVGGTLSLFIGYSIFSIYTQIIDSISMVIKRFQENRLRILKGITKT